MLQLKNIEADAMRMKQCWGARIPRGDFFASRVARVLHWHQLRIQPGRLDVGVPQLTNAVGVVLAPDGDTPEVVLMLPRSLVNIVCREIVFNQRGGEVRTLSSGDIGALTYVLNKLGVDWAEGGCLPFRVKGVLWNPRQMTLYMGEQRLMHLMLHADNGNQTWNCPLVFSHDAGTVNMRTNVGAALDWTLPLAVVVGCARLPLEELIQLEAGDVLWPDSVATWKENTSIGTMWMGNGPVRFAATAVADNKIKLGVKMEEETRTIKSDGVLEKGLENVKVDVQIEIGRLTSSLKEMLNLVPGQVIALEEPVNDKVRLMVGNKLVATGQLVQADNTVAVEILEVFKKNA